MKFGTLTEIVAALHLSNCVIGPFEQRGGLMLISPAGGLKTSIVEILMEFPKVMMISDLTVKSLTDMRDAFLGDQIRTLVFSDFAKLYMRHGSVASNIEGVLMALISDGFRKPAFSDQRIQNQAARVLVIGCMTTQFFERMQSSWLDTGFHRRFLWCRYILQNPDLLEDAIFDWRKAELDGQFIMKIPKSKKIPMDLEEKERMLIRHTMRSLLDRKMPGIIGQRIFAVLKWKLGSEEAKRIWIDFAQSLTPDGAVLELKETERKK
jgi:hypothetical protein